MEQQELADPGGRYAVEWISVDYPSLYLNKALADALNEGAAKGWLPLQVWENSHPGEAIHAHIVWDKQGQ
jgi:hypothetical protein